MTVLFAGCYSIQDSYEDNTFWENENIDKETDDADATDDDDNSTADDTDTTPVNHCLALDGDGDYVRTRYNDQFVVSGEWTMEAWVWYRNDGSLLHPVIRAGDESTSISSYFMYSEYDGGKPMVGIGYSSSSFVDMRVPYRLPTEQWVHMAYVHELDVQRFFINGELVNELESTLDARPVGDDLIIGAILHPNKTGYHNGYIDEVRISRSARYKENFTPREQLADDGKTLVLWNFESEVIDNNITDASGTFRSVLNGDAHIEVR